MRPKLLLLALLISTAATAQQPTAASLARIVDAHYNHLQSLETRYTERYQGMGVDRTETGTLTLRKPGRMRWAYDSPRGKLFVLDGKYATSYTPGDAQATRVPAKQLDDTRSPLRFLLGHAELAKELDHLTLTLVELGEAPGHETASQTGYTLSGTPHGGALNIRSLALTVDARGSIRAMRLEGTDGTVTSFTFTAGRENIPTRDSDFHFLPPPRITVVDGPPPA